MNHLLRKLDLSSPAKVNLALSVGSPNAQGLHPLASWMVTVSLTDRLTLEKLDDESSRFDIAFASETPPSTDSGLPPSHQAKSDGCREKPCVDWPITHDLTYRAHGLLQTYVKKPLPVKLTLRKRIPAESGLGGGSSNAASTLVGINQLYDLGVGSRPLIQLGGQLGSDVGFFVGAALGQPSALVTGVGETVEALPCRHPVDLVLVLPGFGCGTADVYRAFDQRTQTNPHIAPDSDRVRALSHRVPLPPDAPFNDLAQPAFDVQPRLKLVRDQIQAMAELPVHVTGSGSTLFLIASSASHGQELATRISEQTGTRAIATRTDRPDDN